MNWSCPVCARNRYASPKSYFSRVLQLVRANSPYTEIIPFILRLGLKLQALGHPLVPPPDASQALFGWIVRKLTAIWGSSGTAFTLLAAVLTFGQSLYLRHIAIKHRLALKASYLPRLVYIIGSSLHPALGYFSAPLLLNWFLLGGIDCMLGFTRREDQPRTIFNAGFLFACCSLMLFPAVAYLVLLLFSLILLRPFRPGEWIVAILGYLIPFYFAVCLLYLGDGLHVIQHWPRTGLSLPASFKGNIWLPGLITGAIILVALGLYSLAGMLYKLPVATRRSWVAIGAAACLAIPMCIFTPVREPAAWLGIVPALSLIIVPTMLPEKRSRFATFTFYFLIVLVLYCQLTLRL